MDNFLRTATIRLATKVGFVCWGSDTSTLLLLGCRFSGQRWKSVPTNTTTREIESRYDIKIMNSSSDHGRSRELCFLARNAFEKQVRSVFCCCCMLRTTSTKYYTIDTMI